MTREEAMTVIMRLNIVNTGASGAWVEMLIHIVQAGAAAEREACAKVCDDLDLAYEGDYVLATWCATAIRARGKDEA